MAVGQSPECELQKGEVAHNSELHYPLTPDMMGYAGTVTDRIGGIWSDFRWFCLHVVSYTVHVPFVFYVVLLLVLIPKFLVENERKSGNL